MSTALVRNSEDKKGYFSSFYDSLSQSDTGNFYGPGEWGELAFSFRRKWTVSSIKEAERIKRLTIRDKTHLLSASLTFGLSLWAKEWNLAARRFLGILTDHLAAGCYL